MEKRKSSRNYARMSPKQCLKNYKPLLANAKGKYNDALFLAERGSYGTSISLLILSLEETTKALVLYLDGHGFLFRNIKGVSGIFVNHKLRYPLAMIISIASSFGRDFMMLAEKYKNNSEGRKADFARFKNDGLYQAEVLLNYLKQKSEEVKSEVLWYSKAGLLREDGLYVDYVDGTRTPLDITKEHFEHVKQRIDLLNQFCIVFFISLDSKDSDVQILISDFKKTFKAKNYYGMIGKVVAKFNDKEINPFDEIISGIEKFKQELGEFPNKRILE